MRGVPVALLMAALLLGSDPEAYDWRLPRGFPKPRMPANNPMSEVKVQLGRYLFYDQRLSVNRTQSCASCHQQEREFADGRATSSGATGEPHPRSAMSLVNVAYAAALTWADPTLRSLEEQAVVPMFSNHPVELGLSGHERSTLDALRAEPVYRDLFPRAFGESQNPFTMVNAARALAAFERSIISERSPYDRYHTGGEEDAICESAKRGEAVFFTDQVAGCFRCHGGFNFSDAVTYKGKEADRVRFHNTALYQEYPPPNRGLFERTGRWSDIGKFKAPSLCNIALTAPYMHDGSIATLEEVLKHYAAGRAHQHPNKDPRIHKLELSPQNRADLLAFLRALTDEEVLHDPRFANPWEPQRTSVRAVASRRPGRGEGQLAKRLAADRSRPRHLIAAN